MKRVRFALSVLTLAAAGSAALAGPSAEDRAAIQATISTQIAAFGREDGPAAYAIAAEPIHELFPNPEAFLDMVRKGYAPVYHPKTVVFGPITEGDDGPEQEVLVTDSGGVDWIARYALTRDPEGRWRISGCRLVRNDRDAA